MARACLLLGAQDGQERRGGLSIHYLKNGSLVVHIVGRADPAEYLPAAFCIARSVTHVQIIQLWRASPAGLPHRACEHVARKSRGRRCLIHCDFCARSGCRRIVLRVVDGAQARRRAGSGAGGS